ncbi:MAG: galactose-1-phosphate uridylyltransferase [Calditrichaeota bacterium]|nr:MAG: galactose-1-phosphate uridylyltransferase [Calditrichota bacterium]
MPELRKDPIVGRWVIISTERGQRPSDWPGENDDKLGGFCPFCPGNEDKTPAEIFSIRPKSLEPNSSGWDLRVVPNKFPALQIEGELRRRGKGVYDLMNGIGAHEVIIETPDHYREFNDYSIEQIEKILLAYQSRILDLKKDKRFKYILIFKNHGRSAGASLEHSHSQLIATPIVPKNVLEELHGAKRHFDLKERCIFCDIIRQESESDKRVVVQTDNFIAITPFAARFPYEVWILPQAHSSHFESVEKSHYLELAGMMKDILTRLNKALDSPPYNFVIHTSPIQDGNLDEYHWHIEVIPKLTKIAGFEWGSGFYINPTPPEIACEHLRKVGF